MMLCKISPFLTVSCHMSSFDLAYVSQNSLFRIGTWSSDQGRFCLPSIYLVVDATLMLGISCDGRDPDGVYLTADKRHIAVGVFNPTTTSMCRDCRPGM